MQFNEAHNSNQYQITAFETGSVTINQQSFQHAVIITNEQITPWHLECFEHIDETVINKLLSLEPEILLIGTGTKARLPTREMINLTQCKGIGLEVMPTHSACRTYNLMAADERRVVAALLLD